MAEEKIKAVIEVEVDEASAAKAEKKLGGIGKKTSDGTKEATAGFNELRKSIDKVRRLQIADLIGENLDKIKAHTDKVNKSVQKMASGIKNAMGEVAGAFNFKNFDVGDEGIKGYAGAMKISFKEAGASIKSSMKNAGAAVKEFGVMAKAALTSTLAAVALLVAEFVALITAIKNTITVARQLKITLTEAAKIGLDVKEYQEWEYVLGHVGIEVDKLSDFMKTLAAEQNAVRDGSEDTIKAFERLGISAEEAANSTQAELFKKTITGLQQLDSEIERTSLAYRIFGEDDAASLIPILKMTNQEMSQLVNNFYLLGGAASDSLVAKTTILSSAVQNLKTAWMGLRNTLAEALMPVITAVVNALTKAIAIINMFVRAVFGFEIVSGKSASTGGINKATTGIKNYTSGAKEATKAVEKLKRTTMGFDELNIVTNPNSSKSDAGADSGVGDMGFDTGGGGTGFDLSGVSAMSEKMSESLEKWREKIEKWKDTIRALVPIALIGVGVVGGVLAALSGNWVLAIALFALAGIGLYAMVGGEGGIQGYADAFTKACNGLLAPAMIGIGVVGGVIALLCGNIPLAIGFFAMAGLGIALVNISTDGWQPFIDKLKTIFSGLGQFFVNLWNGIVDIFKWAWEKIKVIWGACAEFFATVWEGIKLAFSATAEWLCNVFSAAWEGIKNIWSVVVQFFKNIWEGIKTVFSVTAEWFRNVFQTAWNFIKSIWDVVVGYFRDIWNGIVNIYSVVADWFRNMFSRAWEAIKTIWNAATGYFQGVWNGIKNIFSVVSKWFGDQFRAAWKAITDTFDKAAGYFSGVWSKIKKVFSDASGAIGKAVADTFAKAVNWVLDKAISMINGFIRTLNKAIGIINKIPGVSISTLSEIDIPKLAKGGIATSSTIANIGESGKEAILPLENNTGWMDTLADKIAARNAGAPTNIILTLDGRELGKATIKSINDITKTTGNLPLILR